MKQYKLDSRVLVQIEENFKLSREQASDLLYIRQVDSKKEMFYLERKLSAGEEEVQGNSPRIQEYKNQETQATNKKINDRRNRESLNTKEATTLTVMVQEELPKKKWFFGLF